MKILDAKNKTIGRIASAAAKTLMGKDDPKYTPNKESTAKVQIINASKAKMDQKKMRNTTLNRYSGYASGLKTPSIEQVIAKKGIKEIFRRAVSGMIPRNSLKVGRMKNLEILD